MFLGGVGEVPGKSPRQQAGLTQTQVGFGAVLKVTLQCKLM